METLLLPRCCIDIACRIDGDSTRVRSCGSENSGHAEGSDFGDIITVTISRIDVACRIDGDSIRPCSSGSENSGHAERSDLGDITTS